MHNTDTTTPINWNDVLTWRKTGKKTTLRELEEYIQNLDAPSQVYVLDNILEDHPVVAEWYEQAAEEAAKERM